MSRLDIPPDTVQNTLRGTNRAVFRRNSELRDSNSRKGVEAMCIQICFQVCVQM